MSLQVSKFKRFLVDFASDKVITDTSRMIKVTVRGVNYFTVDAYDYIMDEYDLGARQLPVCPGCGACSGGENSVVIWHGALGRVLCQECSKAFKVEFGFYTQFVDDDLKITKELTGNGKIVSTLLPLCGVTSAPVVNPQLFINRKGGISVLEPGYENYIISELGLDEQLTSLDYPLEGADYIDTPEIQIKYKNLIMIIGRDDLDDLLFD